VGGREAASRVVSFYATLDSNDSSWYLGEQLSYKLYALVTLSSPRERLSKLESFVAKLPLHIPIADSTLQSRDEGIS